MDHTKTLEHIRSLIEKQLERVERMKAEGDFVDYDALDKLIIGVCGGDGIGPAITAEGSRVLEFLLSEEIEAGKIEIRTIEGLTLEKREELGQAIPADTLAAAILAACLLSCAATSRFRCSLWINITTVVTSVGQQNHYL